MANAINLADGERAERKLLVTVAEWDGTKYGGTSSDREVLGRRTPDSSIEFNPDITTETDILGITYTDVNKTEPQQDFDPFTILGGSALGAYLSQAALVNDIAAYNNVFTIYILTLFISADGTVNTSTSYAVKHDHCSIIPTSMGGESYVNMPIEVHYSNDITKGRVNLTADGKVSKDFNFITTGSLSIGEVGDQND